jgi:cation diffusion facilitator family transporter
MSGHGQGDPKKVVLAAMMGNSLVALLKFVAAGFSGSVTMLAEGVHSVADSANQALLLVGIILSRKKDPQRYPLGRAKEVYFWAFVVALVLFFLGGVYAVYEGIEKLIEPPAVHHAGPPYLSVSVLTASILFEGASFVVALREFNKQRGRRGLDEALFQGRDPTIPVVLLEDSAAMVGLLTALVAVVASWLTASPVPDAVGSLLIGLLLCSVGVALARDTRSLIIGEGVTADVRRRALALCLEVSGVERVTQLLSYHLGPDTVILALKVGFSRGVAVEQVERITNDLEARVRRELPQMKRIFVEADGAYDSSRDPDAPASATTTSE